MFALVKVIKKKRDNKKENLIFNNKVFKTPKIPQSFLNQDIVLIFIEETKKSKIFIY